MNRTAHSASAIESLATGGTCTFARRNEPSFDAVTPPRSGLQLRDRSKRCVGAAQYPRETGIAGLAQQRVRSLLGPAYYLASSRTGAAGHVQSRHVQRHHQVAQSTPGQNLATSLIALFWRFGHSAPVGYGSISRPSAPRFGRALSKPPRGICCDAAHHRPIRPSVPRRPGRCSQANAPCMQDES